MSTEGIDPYAVQTRGLTYLRPLKPLMKPVLLAAQDYSARSRVTSSKRRGIHTTAKCQQLRKRELSRAWKNNSPRKQKPNQ